MKYLVLFLVLAVVYAVWRSQNRPSVPPPPQPPPPPGPPPDMGARPHPGPPLPRPGGFTPRQRHYCCAEHQRSDA